MSAKPHPPDRTTLAAKAAARWAQAPRWAKLAAVLVPSASAGLAVIAPETATDVGHAVGLIVGILGLF